MNRTLGIIAVMVAAVIFGSMPLMARIIYAEGGNPMMTSIIRGVLAMPVLYLLARFKSGETSMKVSKKDFKQLWLVGVLGYGATVLTLYASYLYIPVGVATTLHFAYPIFVILGSIIFFKVRPSGVVKIAVALCLGGMLLFNPVHTNLDPLGVALAFGSSITFAFYVLFIEKSGLNQMGLFKLTFYLSLTSSSVIFLIGLATGTTLTGLSLYGWGVAFLLAMTVTVGAIVLFQLGIRTVGSQNTAILSTFEPITSIIIGFTLFQEVIDIKTIGGILLILLAVLLIAFFEK